VGFGGSMEKQISFARRIIASQAADVASEREARAAREAETCGGPGGPRVYISHRRCRGLALLGADLLGSAPSELP
jgi:hypothetical protein